MNVRPLHDRVILQRLEEDEQRIGGIIIPDSAKESRNTAKSLPWARAKWKRTAK